MHKNKIYTGVGSRQTPPEVLSLMEKIGYVLARHGWTLRSGHARGADQAFEAGASLGDGKMEIFLPWEGFEGKKHDGVSYFSYPIKGNMLCRHSIKEMAEEVAEHFHPNWSACTQGARKMHTRNVYQVAGLDLSCPSDVVVCWTPDGRGEGGTGQALRIAEYLQVPVFDLAVRTEQELLEFINNGVLP